MWLGILEGSQPVEVEGNGGMAANQALSANITAFNVLKQVVAKGLEIGK